VLEWSGRCEAQRKSTSASGELAGGRFRPFLFLRPARFPIPTSQNRRTHKAKGREREREREREGVREAGQSRREKFEGNKKGKK